MPTTRTAIRAILSILMLTVAGCCHDSEPSDVALTHGLTTVRAELPKLGHRNWIVIADSAYPWQSREGIETLISSDDQIEAVKAVLDAIDHTRHVRPNVFLDAELPHVAEADAPGVGQFRDQLSKVLDKRNVQSLPHEQIIGKLDESAKTFHVLIVKTNLTIPYTSVFIQLDCAYWSADAEKRLRDAIGTTEPAAH